MKYLFFILMLIFVFSGCDDSSSNNPKNDADTCHDADLFEDEDVSDNETDEDAVADEDEISDETIDEESDTDEITSDSDIPECENGEEKTEKCGYNNNGAMHYICENGTWVIDIECDDPDACLNDDTHSENCGAGNAGTIVYTCIDGAWAVTSECDKPVECEDGAVKAEAGSYYECIIGEWKLKRKTYQWGSSEWENNGSAIAVDAEGSVYIAGYTAFVMEGDTMVGGDYDSFVTKFSSTGEKLWTKQIGTEDNEYPSSVLVDNSGDIYVVGMSNGIFDGALSNGNDDIFIAKFDKEGNKIWIKQFGTTASDMIGDAATDGTSIYVTGSTGSAFAGTINLGSTDAFLVKFDSNGNLVWNKMIGSTEEDFGYGVTVSNSGDIFITGLTAGNIDGVTNTGDYDIFVTKFQNDGTKEWTLLSGTEAQEQGKGIFTDASGNIYVYGETYIESETENGNFKAMLTKFDSSRNKLWNVIWGSPQTEQVTSGVIDSAGFIYIAGHTTGSIDGNTNIGYNDIYITKFDGDGNKIETYQFGTESDEGLMDMVIDSYDVMYATGSAILGLDGNSDISSNYLNPFFMMIK